MRANNRSFALRVMTLKEQGASAALGHILQCRHGQPHAIIIHRSRMTNSSSFKRVSSSKAKVSAPQSPALSRPPRTRRRSRAAPPPRNRPQVPRADTSSRRRYAPILDTSDASDDDLDASAGYESDGISAVIQTLMQKTQQKEKASAKKAESAARPLRTEALRKAEEAIRAAKAIADKEIHAAQQSCERKIQQETKRHRAAADALDSSLKELLADVAKATKSIKTAKKESDKEIDDCKRAGQRVLATHEANLQRIEKEATTKTAGFLKAPLKLGGIVHISSLAKSIEEEEAA